MSRRTFAAWNYLGSILLLASIVGLGGPALATVWGGGNWATLAAVAVAGTVAMFISAGYGLLLLQVDARLRNNRDKNERIRA